MPKTSKPKVYTDTEKAVAFLNTARGRYIVAQALELAIIKLDEVPGVYKQASNIEDMRFLRRHLFNFPISVE